MFTPSIVFALLASSATALRIPKLDHIPTKLPRAEATATATTHHLFTGTATPISGSVVLNNPPARRDDASSSAAPVFITVSATVPAQTLIPADSFSSNASFSQYFANLYPWGTDLNGAARMTADQVTLADSTLTLNATPVTGQKPAEHGGSSIPINYFSGTVHAKQTFTVNKDERITYSGSFKAPVERGTWPAFWLTAVVGWPPEIDMAEWKGDGKISFNTFNTSSQVQAQNVEYANPDEWHDIRCETKDVNGEDVEAQFFMDGSLMATQVGKGYVGKAMYLIINLQMEGSSGSPGPTGIRNVTVVKT
ncbi:hypothetical protein TD95_004974 [Thielaviopsis punctulata]|uniref:GH16 domain-containing protein n=1 Tax=Thielaviopsis punctulata TaxID=72032 RepID=A0A0F4ZJZ4_9PEZI|nr:hypothetical protein TD95_004974 [Thielaviopsis punctulata]